VDVENLPAGAELVQVSRVIDGDTVDLRLPDLGGRYARERVRLLRITAPELTGGSAATRKRAFAARAQLRSLLVGVEVAIVREAERDKYGRTLARLWIRWRSGEWEDVEEIMVDEGFARWWTARPVQEIQ